MDGFSVISLTSLTSTISNRALSAVEDLDDLTSTLEPHHAAAVAAARLSTSSALLRDLDRHAAQLETALHGASAISQRLQTDLTRSLGACDGLVAGLSKQVSGLQAHNVARVDAGVLGVQGGALEAYCRLFELFVKMLCLYVLSAYCVMPGLIVVCRSDKDAQDGVLDSVEGRTVLEQACLASEKASQGDLLLSGRDYGIGASSRGPSDTTIEPPPYENAASSSSPTPTPAPTSSSSSGFAKGMSSLTNSLKAMTASLWPKPDPLATAFCQAALRGDVQQMSGFLAQGANINGRNGESNTPLGCAILANQVDAVQFLLAAGADTAASSGSSKLPPLFLAASAGSGEVVKLLLARGADVNQKSWTGQPYFVEVAEGEMLRALGCCSRGERAPTRRTCPVGRWSRRPSRRET